MINGTQISNQAVLTFDGVGQNTPTWLNTVDETPPTSHVVALGGTQGAPSFTVQWSADGAPPDLKDYTVCVREDNGPYRAWRTNTAAVSDTFMASRTDHTVHTYSFYSIARDQVGNMETAPANPDYDTQTLSTTGVEPGSGWRLALGGARPNPAHGSINVWFTLANREPAALEMIDIAGRRVTRREVGSMGAGPHLVNLGVSLTTPQVGDLLPAPDPGRARAHHEGRTGPLESTHANLVCTYRVTGSSRLASARRSASSRSSSRPVRYSARARSSPSSALVRDQQVWCSFHHTSLSSNTSPSRSSTRSAAPSQRATSGNRPSRAASSAEASNAPAALLWRAPSAPSVERHSRR